MKSLIQFTSEVAVSQEREAGREKAEEPKLMFLEMMMIKMLAD